MSATIRIPSVLRPLTGGAARVPVTTGATLAAAIGELGGVYPGLRDRLLDESGQIREFVNVFVNGEDVRFLAGVETPLAPGDEVSIVPAVAGG
ncbi:MAG TPA: ubiquitin-like small modifier protein 1 [Dehalococcoidia bacterium]|nr:ubiquitin-like small modifier protein 1 [Dehalococcoidia bacterium]